MKMVKKQIATAQASGSKQYQQQLDRLQQENERLREENIELRKKLSLMTRLP